MIREYHGLLELMNWLICWIAFDAVILLLVVYSIYKAPSEMELWDEEME